MMSIRDTYPPDGHFNGVCPPSPPDTGPDFHGLVCESKLPYRYAFNIAVFLCSDFVLSRYPEYAYCNTSIVLYPFNLHDRLQRIRQKGDQGAQIAVVLCRFPHG